MIIIDGVKIVVPVSEDLERSQTWCDLCGDVASSYEDRLAFEEMRVCSRCYDVFVRPDKDRWISGWRPARKDIDDDMKKRSPVAVLKRAT